MRLHELNTDDAWETAADGERFIVLGSRVEGERSQVARRRIKGETAELQYETWETLGSGARPFRGSAADYWHLPLGTWGRMPMRAEPTPCASSMRSTRCT